MKIEILGSGCAKCQMLAQNARAATDELGVVAKIEKVEDIREIMKYGVINTPALVVNGQVKASGKVLSATEIKPLLL